MALLKRLIDIYNFMNQKAKKKQINQMDPAITSSGLVWILPS